MATLKDQLSLKVGQKYCRMLQGAFGFKIFILS